MKKTIGGQWLAVGDEYICIFTPTRGKENDYCR